MAGISLVLDCDDPRLWRAAGAAALRYRRTRAAGQRYALLTGAPDRIPDPVLQRIPEPKADKNRMHLDIVAPDIEREMAAAGETAVRRAPGPELRRHPMEAGR